MKENITPAALAAAAAGDLANFIVASTPGGIERQEAEGQRAMIEASYLPRKINTHGVTWDDLVTRWGVTYAPYSTLFHSVTLPEGWKLVPTEHSMHSGLLDDRGRQRARIFYKAAFYDERADMTLEARYGIEPFRSPDDGAAEPELHGYRIVDRATATIVETIGTVPYRAWDASDKLHQKARQRLAELFPDHANPFAYWNE